MLEGLENLGMKIKTKETGIPKITGDSPLAVRMRPKTIQEVLGQDGVLREGAPLLRLIQGDTNTAPSIILWGPPGTGKTTIAYLIAENFNEDFVELSAVSDGSKILREIIEEAKIRKQHGNKTILFIDEIHRFNKAQQDILLPAVENQWITLIAATTENPSFSIISPLLSRSLIIQLQSVSHTEMLKILENALTSEKGLNNEYSIEEEAAEALARFAGGDVRKALTLLEAAAGEEKVITLEILEKVSDSALVRWDQDQHYDVASAFIKSMRGSDPDATLHYLARMIKAGEDPRFIARRIMIAASEDVGLADNNVLVLAVSAAEAVAKIGFPEARIILSQAALAVALAPKSNSAYIGIDKALRDLDKGKIGSVPLHLRDTHYEGSKALGHGEGYLYSHDQPYGISAQEYLPEELKGAEYYIPSNRGREKSIAKLLPKIKALLKGEKLD